jgi:homoserine O-succinyltransferase
MPLTFDNGQIPTRWADNQHWRSMNVATSGDPGMQRLDIALVNNMPDPALEDTELQFFELVSSAATAISVHIELYSLPNLLRGERAQQHLKSFYHGIGRLLDRHFDGVIITGTEPLQADLRCEPYWTALAEVLDWAEENTLSTVLSCLAAHAGVLHSDGIQRQPLGDKQFGVFTSRSVCDHFLTKGAADHLQFPHSRWNEVKKDALTACGYSVLTGSPESGVDLFIKKKRESLFVHFQGHPEYSLLTLLKEFRRDIKRFLRGERKSYPTMPHGYFDATSTEALNVFQEKALLHREEQTLSEFPEGEVVKTLQNTWRSAAECIYANWLRYIVSKKMNSWSVPVMVRVGRA